MYRWCRQYEPVGVNHHEDYWEKVDKDPHTRMYGVEHGGILVGICGLTSIDWINRRAEFSLYIDPDKHGQGLGERALSKLVSHGLNVLNLNCIWGEAFEGNPAIEMFKKVGFKEEGRRRQFYYREGKYIDAVLFSTLKEENGNRDTVPMPTKYGPKPYVTSPFDEAIVRIWGDTYPGEAEAAVKTIRKAKHSKVAKGKRRSSGLAKRK